MSTMSYRYLSIVPILILTGCATTPVCPPPEVITTVITERVPVPGEFTGPCAVDCGEIVTNGDLLECHAKQRAALAECNARITAIRELR